MLARLATDLREEFDQNVVCLLDRGALAPRLESSGIPVTAISTSARIPNPLVTVQLARRLKALFAPTSSRPGFTSPISWAAWPPVWLASVTWYGTCGAARPVTEPVTR